MNRPILALLAAVLPLVTAAQGFVLRRPSVGESLDTIERLESQKKRSLEQVFIVPERPGQNAVSWFDFNWHYHDVPAPGGGPGGIRLYYYQSERGEARRALPAIQSAYARLVELFHYNPTRRIPYILYATQREFQTTNVFEVTESVLGVTSPQDLKMTVPYFGDHARFVEVSTHEMVHQFTIQKLLEASSSDDMGSAIERLPLWFIEGIAEYYSKGGIDVETDVFLRDLVWNPDPRKGYEVLPFAEDRLRGYIPTYKLGQARVAFIADVYGREKVQAFLENAPLLGGDATGGGGSGKGFGALVRRVLNEPLEQVDARWKTWMKRRYYPEYLRAQQDLPQAREIRDLPNEPEAYSVSPDGNVILARAIDRERGRARLYLFDVRNPRGAVEIAEDGIPGIETLHPIEYNVLAVSESLLVFSAQDGIGDRLYLQRFRHKAPAQGKRPTFQIGRRHALDVRPPGQVRFIQIADPALSPDGTQVAFVGVARDGQQDIYIASVRGGEARRLTNDFYSKKDLYWTKDGIYVASDATDHGRLNLFRLDPTTGVARRLTTAPTNDRYPRPQADGSILFSSDAGGKPDIHLLRDGKIQRLTDFSTGLNAPGPAPKGRGIFASTFNGGTFHVVELPKVAWLESPAVAVPPASGSVLEIPSADFPPDIPQYDPFSLKNWKPEAGIVYGGGAGNGVAGRAAVIFDDLLRDHVLFIDLSVWGSFDYTQALVLFENRSRRTSWAVGGFHFVQQQIDRRDPNLAYYQRDFGAVTAIRYPLDRFRRFELELNVGGVQRYCLTDFSGAVTLQCGGIQTNTSVYPSNEAWKQENGGTTASISPTVRFGYDTVRYDQYTGPISGGSLLLEVGGYWLPWKEAVNAFARLDAEKWWQVIGRANLQFRLALGTAVAPDSHSAVWERSWWLTSADNLRGYHPYDLAYLIGTHYYVANAEFQFPLDMLIRLLFFDYIEGVAAVDFGGVFNTWESQTLASGTPQPGAWESRTLTGVLGVNVLFGPLLLRVHFGHPFDIGGVKTPALQHHTSWVTNITLRYFFF